MAALVNGTYLIASTLSGGNRFYLGFSSGAPRENLVNGLEDQQVHERELGRPLDSDELTLFHPVGCRAFE